MEEKKEIIMFFCRDCMKVRAFKKTEKGKYKCLDCGREEENIVVQIIRPSPKKN